jgi:hypothetical protein
MSISTHVKAPPIPAIGKKPGMRTRKPRARFTFKGANPGVNTYRCSLDSGKFVKCASPTVYRHLTPGRHRFRVQPTDFFGTVGPTAAYRWSILGPKRRGKGPEA